jgi:integrase
VLSAYLDQYAPTSPSEAWIKGMAIPVINWWHGKMLSEVVAHNCKAYWEHREATPIAKFTKSKPRRVSKATAKHELSVLAAAIRWWHRKYQLQGLAPAVTFPPKDEPRADRESEYFLTREEFERRVEIAGQDPKTRHLVRVLLIGWYSGTRPGAILKLRWLPSTTGGYIDLKKQLIYRRPFGAKRSRKRAPPCRIHVDLLPHLNRWKAADDKLRIIDVVTYRGKPVLKIRRSWEAVRKAPGASEKDAPHVMRHSAATWLMQAGVPIPEAAAFLGMSIEVMTSTYAHHHPATKTRRPLPVRPSVEL